MDLQSGQLLNERYRIIRQIGAGGMGVVYYGHDQVLDRPVAIKQLRLNPITDEQPSEQLREQFLREAKSLAALHHPNLPRVTDYFTVGDLQYLVMDYIEGQSLQEILKAQPQGIDEARALDWAIQLLSALDYIHQHHLIHRDIKPANIRLTSDNRIFLVDFGLVKAYDPINPKTLTMFHGMGTIEYAPPEQYDTRAHTDPRSDIYSLGATLYHLAAGHAPVSVSQRISDPAAYQPPRAHNANISPEVEQAIVRAMELERARRFASAADMQAALQYARQLHAVDTGNTIGLSLTPAASSAQRRPQRRWLAIASVPIILIAIAIVGATYQSNVSVAQPSSSTSPTPTATASANSTSTGSSTPTSSLTTTPSPTSTGWLLTQTSTPQPTATLDNTQPQLPATPSRGQPTPKVNRTPPGQDRPTNSPPGQSNNPGGGKTKKSP